MAKVTITTNAILNANNARTYENEWHGQNIVSNFVEIPVDAIVDFVGSDEDKAYIESKVKEYSKKDGELVKSVKITLSDNMTIHDKNGEEIDVENNIKGHIGLAKVVVSVFVDKNFGNTGMRANALVFNVDSPDEVSQYIPEPTVKSGPQF